MAKLTLSPIAAFTQSAITTINQNMDDIETALEKTLSRDGTIPNQMTADLDMNTNDILNVDNLDVQGSFTLNGELVLPGDVTAADAPALLALIETVDGAGSGLDADLVDGLHASAFVLNVADRTALKAVDTTLYTTAVLREAGRQGLFKWTTGDLSTFVAADVAEGLYVKADAIASTSGAWVRVRSNLDALLSWFGGTTGAGSATANNAAFASAKALSNVQTIVFEQGTYEFSSTLILDRNGLSLRGVSSFPMFGSGGSATTLLKWTGAADSQIIKIAEPSGNDVYNNKVEGLELNGNALAAVGIDIINTQFTLVQNVAINTLKTTGTSLGIRTTTTAVAGSNVNCVYRGRFVNISIGVSGNSVGMYFAGNAGVGNTTFCHIESVHIVHENGSGFYLVSADDNSFMNCATSRLAGGTGSGVTFDGTGAQWVVGNTFWQFHAGVTDGVATITSTGAKARQNKMYGLSGVDNNPTINVTVGSHLQYDFMGTGYTSSLSSEAAIHRMAEAHLTALRLGSDYTTYSTMTRDVNANDKVISNNPGTGGFEWQIGGVASVNYTLAKQTITSFDASATLGPQLELFRDSASPAAADTLGYINWTGRSSNGTKRVYADLFVVIADATDASEDSNTTFRAMVNGTLTNVFQATGVNVTFTGNVLSSSATAGVGYATGAGGTIVQGTSRTTGVTLNKVSGAITMFTAAGSATPASFTVTNSAVAATDTIVLNIKSGATNTYFYFVTTVAAGSFVITFWTTGGTASDTPVINFNVIKGVAA